MWLAIKTRLLSLDSKCRLNSCTSRLHRIPSFQYCRFIHTEACFFSQIPCSLTYLRYTEAGTQQEMRPLWFITEMWPGRYVINTLLKDDCSERAKDSLNTLRVKFTERHGNISHFIMWIEWLLSMTDGWGTYAVHNSNTFTARSLCSFITTFQPYVNKCTFSFS